MPNRHVVLDKIEKSGNLYHYTKCKGVQGILKDKAFFATKSDFLNDTNEMRYTLALVNEVLEGISAPESRPILLSSLAVSAEDMKKQNYFVLSFSVDADSITLWSEFGNNTGYNLEFRSSELFAKYCRSFRKAVSIYSVFFKQEEFAAEKEYRVVFKENDEREIRYREKNGFLLPYITIGLRNACSAVNKITVAPQNHVDLAKEGMEMYARQLGYDAQVCFSKIKLRY